MAHPYTSGDGSGYSDQTYQTFWATSTAMTRNTSHGSGYSNHSGSNNGQYDVAVSPSSDLLTGYDFQNVPNAGTYIMDVGGQNAGYQIEESNTGYQVEDTELFFHYDFITVGNLGQGPYWRLKSCYAPTTDYPATIPVEPNPVELSTDVPRPTNDSSGRHVCLERFCTATPFKRKADLERHYLHKHRDPKQKKPFPCDWKKCQRSKEPFFRLDHCREHYRDYHMEDLKPRGSEKMTEEWWKSRKVDSKWWRCTKCLSRIPTDSNGFECSKCKTTCESERRKLRGYK